MADVVARAMMDDETVQALQKAGVSQYTVQYDTLSAGPILILQTEGSTPQNASNSLAVLAKDVPLSVARLQREASIRRRSFISAQVIARPSTPAKSGKTQLRAMALALVAGLVLTLLAVSFAEARRIRRLRVSPEDPYDTEDFGEQTPAEYVLRESNGATAGRRGADARSSGSGDAVVVRESAGKGIHPPTQ
jgi:hypothetical protein